MTINEIAMPPAPTPGLIGQATAVEQSRAVAEVQAAVLVARQFPRDEQRAIRKLTQACEQDALASRAFFRYSRAGSAITGPSIHLARTIAACWGNVDYGIAEMRRDDQAGESEMKAWAWDQEDNVRTSNTFIVPHTRDSKKGTQKLTDTRDVYENNANQGARRVRECVFALVPTWFVELGKDLCQKTLKAGGGVPLPQRIAKVIANFTELGVTVDQLERKLERPAAKWTDQDVATLWVVGRSLSNGEITKDEEFPSARVTAEEIASVATAPAPAPSAAAAPVADRSAAALVNGQPTTEPLVSREQRDALQAALAACGVSEREVRSTLTAMVRRDLETSGHLTAAEADELLAVLHRLAQRPEPARELDAYLAILDEVQE